MREAARQEARGASGQTSVQSDTVPATRRATSCDPLVRTAVVSTGSSRGQNCKALLDRCWCFSAQVYAFRLHGPRPRGRRPCRLRPVTGRRRQPSARCGNFFADIGRPALRLMVVSSSPGPFIDRLGLDSRRDMTRVSAEWVLGVEEGGSCPGARMPVPGCEHTADPECAGPFCQLPPCANGAIRRWSGSP
jgi:hypothetical protein